MVKPSTGLFLFTIKTNASLPIGVNSNSTPLSKPYLTCSSLGLAQKAISQSPSTIPLKAPLVLWYCKAESLVKSPFSYLTDDSG